MPFAIPETKIASFTKDNNKQWVLKLIIKEEDMNKETEDLIYERKKQGVSIAIAGQEIEEEYVREIDPCPALRQRLAMLMQDYSKASGIDLEVVKRDLYDKRKIDSREELSKGELEDEIRSFEAYLYNPQ